MYILKILVPPNYTVVTHAKYQLQSRLPERIKAEPFEAEDHFYFEFDISEEKADEILEWMTYCGYTVKLKQTIWEESVITDIVKVQKIISDRKGKFIEWANGTKIHVTETGDIQGTGPIPGFPQTDQDEE